jgi:light-regulated signal transduction histidine kinase (bacteriophytochrome)
LLQASRLWYNGRKELIRTNRELEEATWELREANAALDAFVHTVSHDLKAPLWGISQLADWTSTAYAGVLDEDRREMSALLRGRIRRMRGLTDGTPEYSCTGRIAKEERLMDLNELLRETIFFTLPKES